MVQPRPGVFADRSLRLDDTPPALRDLSTWLEHHASRLDPESLEVTGVVDWEFAHSGLPCADLGNLLRFERDEVFGDAVLGGYRDFMPAVPDDLLDRARAADLFALVDLAARETDNEIVVRSRELPAAVARTGRLHAVPA
jgi:hypothetical protein